MLRGTSCQSIYPTSPERRQLAGNAPAEASAPEHPYNVLWWKPTHCSWFSSAPIPLRAAHPAGPGDIKQVKGMATAASRTPVLCSQKHPDSHLLVPDTPSPASLCRPCSLAGGSSSAARAGAGHQPQRSRPPFAHRLFQLPGGCCVGISLLKHQIL